MTRLEKHGKALSAEGKVFKGKSGVNNFEDSPLYRDPGFREQSASKYIGPPDIKENEKKSDAYEVINGNDRVSHESTITEPNVAKSGHAKATRAHSSDEHAEYFPGNHRSGLHIVSLTDGLDEGRDDKDKGLYGSIGSPSSSSVGLRPRFSRRRHIHSRSGDRHRYDPYEFFPQNIVSLSQEDILGPFTRHGFHARSRMFPTFKRHKPYFVSSSAPLAPPEGPIQSFRPLNPKSFSYGDRPNLFLVPVFNGRSDTDPAVLPVTAQSSVSASQSQMGQSPVSYPSVPSTGAVRNGLLFQPALQVPVTQTQSGNFPYAVPDNLPYTMPIQTQQTPLLDSQQQDLRSLYEYQLQSPPQMPAPQLPTLPQAQTQQPIMIPTSVALGPNFLGAAIQGGMRPIRWADEAGHGRSEVLEQQRGATLEDGLQDYRDYKNEEEDNASDDDNRERSMYGDMTQRSMYGDMTEESHVDDSDDYRVRQDPISDDDQDRLDSRERPFEEDNEDSEDSENDESNDETASNAYQGREPAPEEEQTSNISPPLENDSDDQEEQEEDHHLNFFSPQSFRHVGPVAFPRVMEANRNFLPPNLPLDSPGYQFGESNEAPAEMRAPAFARYQTPLPSAAVKEHVLPDPPLEPTSAPTRSPSGLTISQLSSAEAEFFENKATLDPNFAPPLSSKDTIPRKFRRFRGGFGNVLIRLNGLPLEDSTQLKSKIIHGHFVQGKGKLIKSKGPVRVRLSHTKDAKHLKIVDIIAPKQVHVYDTKSKIRRPLNYPQHVNKTNNAVKEVKVKRRALI